MYVIQFISSAHSPVFSGRVPPLHQPIKRTCPEGAYLLNAGPRVSFRAPYLAQVKKQNRSNNHKSLSAKRWQQGSKYATEHSHDNLGKVVFSSFKCPLLCLFLWHLLQTAVFVANIGAELPSCDQKWEWDFECGNVEATKGGEQTAGGLRGAVSAPANTEQTNMWVKWRNNITLNWKICWSPGVTSRERF